MVSIEQRLDNIERMLKIILKSNQQGEMPGEIIGVTEAAEICGLSVRTLRNYVSNGTLNIPVSKRGKFLEMRKSELLLWNAQRVRQTL